jgi:hypothetical protein
MESAIERAVRYDDLRSLGVTARMNYSDPSLEWVAEKFEILAAEVFRVDEGDLAISVQAAFEGLITCHHLVRDYHDPDEPPDDWWEEHTGDAQFTVHFGGVISEDEGDVKHQSIDHVDVAYGGNWDRPDYGD